MVTTEEAKRKWRENFKSAIPYWLSRVTAAGSYDEFCRAIAAFLGVSEATVKASFKGKAWRDFQADVAAHPDVYRRKMEEAATVAKADKWLSAFTAAFTTAA